LAGQPAALAAFDRTYLAHVRRFVASVDSSPAFADEVRQLLRERLFLPSGGSKLREYTGAGPLGAWLRVVALRVALNLRRDSARAAARGVEKCPTDAVCNTELDYLKDHYAEHVRAALEATVDGLPIEERNVLRLHYLDGLPLQHVADICRVHRATVARWIAGARERVLDETRRRLTQHWKLSGSELDSILELVRSRLDVSFHRLLQSKQDAQGPAHVPQRASLHDP